MSRQKIKYLYILKTDDAKIVIRCAYSVQTKNVTVQMVKQYNAQKIYSKLHSKIPPVYTINKNQSPCNILQQHAKELVNDPERLSTKFLKGIIGAKCK